MNNASTAATQPKYLKYHNAENSMLGNKREIVPFSFGGRGVRKEKSMFRGVQSPFQEQ